ncbi:MAG: transporter [Pirellulales bacterium]|nr:transporter [Pirellulales bacterium]
MRKGLLRGWSKGLTLGAALVGGATPSVASAQAPTLFQWNYGDGGEGLTAAEKLEEPLASDRPDFTEASSTVGLGVVQLESGYTYTYDSNDVGSTKSHSFPEALLRVGMLAEWFEFRIAQNYAEETTTDFGVSRTTETGAEDLYLGIKWGLTAQEGILPEMALMTQMTVPSGASAFTAGETLPGVVWLYGWDVNDWIVTGGQTKADRALDDVTGDPFLEFSQSWTVGYSLAESLGAYTEWFVIAPDGADTNHTENYADGGFTYSVTNNLQLDIRAGVGLNEAADDYFVGSGFAIRR